MFSTANSSKAIEKNRLAGLLTYPGPGAFPSLAETVAKVMPDPL